MLNEKDDQKIFLREEILDISKNKIDTNEVTIYKKTVKEDRNITVPIIHEELVIEKKALDNNKTDIINIPISEEKIEIKKYIQDINNIKIDKNTINETIQIKEKIKKENEQINILGNVTIENK